MRDIDIFAARSDKLMALAEKDDSYMVWKQTFQHNKKDFERLMRFMPKKWRNTIVAYAESGRLMMQRTANLACLHMDFAEKPLNIADFTDREE